MPQLSNPKREIFAQEMANGAKLADAYEKAGFRKHRANAYAMKQRPEVQARISELLKERESAITTRYAAEVEYTRETLLDELEDARQTAVEDGNPTAMVSATMGKARILGLIIDRREVGDVGAFDGHTDEELVALAARRARELGFAGPVPVEPEKPEDDPDKAA